MRLGALLADLPVVSVHGDLDVDVRLVTRDSREVQPNTVFVAVRGAHVDGHDFVADVDAAAVVVEPGWQGQVDCPVVRVEDTKAALAQLAAALHGHPARQLSVVGITGTNGKTTVSTLVDEALRHMGVPSARIGTTGTWIRGEPRPTALTTPEAPALQALFAEMRDNGVRFVVMEVSSIGLIQHRVDAIPFSVAAFTNLSRDHLDFHGTFEAYTQAKARLFAMAAGRAVLCSDDAHWREMNASDPWLYGFGEDAHFRILEAESSVAGTALMVETPDGTAALRSPLVGRFNALNLTGALAILLALGVSLDDAVHGLSQVRGVPGRLEGVDNDRGLLVLVDYAHTPDALQTALRAVREAVDGQVWVVFGCGGDRDRGKRPEMGRAAERGADQVVVTSDNPRSEPPQAIIDEVLAGMDGEAAHVDADRAAAIRWAVERAQPGDAVLIAGKGHETYQEIAGEKRPFDDREVAREALNAD